MSPRRIAARVAVVAASVLALAAVVRHVRKSHATAMLQEYMVVPVNARGQLLLRRGQVLASFPGGMPGNGFSGRATNEEDYTDPYGGGDVPGPYGRVNDPYDGDWALGPLGGKAVGVQGLRMVPSASTDRNIWDSQGEMGTNSIFMGNMPQSIVTQRNMQRVEAERMAAKQASQQQLQPHEDKSWVGTNEAFIGANGGGYGLARGAKKAGLAHKATARGAKKASKAAVPKSRKAALSAKMMSLFRSDDAHEAEYGREGPNMLDDSVLPSAVGSGGPVIGVDGMASNLDHKWAKHDEPFSFACDPSISGCENGLTVDPLYAHD